MLQVSKCLIGLAVMVLQSCDITDNRSDLLCGNWESVEGKPDVLIYKEGEAYKVTVFKRSGIRRKLKPETYLCLLYTSPSPRDRSVSRMPSSA